MPALAAKGCIGQIIVRRNQMAIDFRKGLANLVSMEDEIEEQLLDSVSEPIRKLLEADQVIEKLFLNGYYSTNMSTKMFGFKNLAYVLEQFEVLKKQWDGIVQVKVSGTPYPNRVEITFRAVI